MDDPGPCVSFSVYSSHLFFLFFFFAHLLTQNRNYGFLDRTQEQQYLLRVVFKETLKDIHFPVFLLI